MKQLEELVFNYPVLKENQNDIQDAYRYLLECVQNNGIIYMCGNGGSYSDAQHMAGELLKSFIKKRPVPSAIKKEWIASYGQNGQLLANHLECGIQSTVLGCHDTFTSAFSNDVSPELVYAQELFVRGKKEDVLVCFSTSGNSKNVYYAALVAQSIGMKVILISGKHSGTISKVSTCTIHVPETETYKVQELTLPIYHALCLALEDQIF